MDGTLTKVAVDVEDIADIGVVCGSLGPLRKGLNSHEGVSLELREPGSRVPSRDKLFLDEYADRFERRDPMDDREGEELRVLVGVSGGNSA